MIDKCSPSMRSFVLHLMGVAFLPLVAFGQAPATPSGGGAGLSVADDGTSLTVRHHQAVVIRYRYGAKLFKPYVAELRLPDGRNLLRDSPADHIHHHALMFAWNVDGVEFWGEAGQVGRQVHRAFKGLKPGATSDRAVIVESLDWVGPDGKTVLLREHRTITTYADSTPADRLIAWQSDLVGADPKRDVTITGRSYLGLGARFRVPMDRGARFATAKGQTDVKRVNGSKARWCAITGNVEPDKPITFAMLDDPKNPRHPAKWFAMNKPFAYLSATIGLEGKPFVLKAGQHLVVRYGVAAWARPAGPERVEHAYRAWRKLLETQP
jgi:hypothetical protein